MRPPRRFLIVRKVIFCLDVSGSMSTTMKLDEAKMPAFPAPIAAKVRNGYVSRLVALSAAEKSPTMLAAVGMNELNPSWTLRFRVP